MDNMDEKDRKIIEMLEEDARRSFTEIAKNISVSEATVRKRVEKLEKRGIIEGYTTDVNPESLGYNTIALLGLDVEPENLLEAAETIGKMDEVKSAATCTGDHMIMAEIWAKDNRHLGEIMSEKIGSIEGVKNLRPAIVMEEIKG